jgi:DNA-3-methyladenine glycosylase II
MKKVLNHFRKQDPIIYKHLVRLGKQIKTIKKDKPDNYFYRLCREIVCQQLSSQSGNAILGRFIKLFPHGIVRPNDILSINHDQLRSTGMSNAKARYVRNLAENIVQGDLQIDKLNTMTDNEVVLELTRVKGIGPWTAEMFLIFTLGRQDVFSFGDLGLKKGLIKIYNLKKEVTKEQIENIISHWAPYKTYASLVLWASLDK